MPISQCPKCVLKFSSRSEMQWHFREDHPKPLPSTAPPVITIPVSQREPVPDEDRPSWWARTRKAVWPSR